MHDTTNSNQETRFYANRRGQDLARHSVLVARLAEKIVRQAYPGREDDMGEVSQSVEVIRQIAYAAGLLHDIGKISPEFSAYMRQMVEGDVRKSKSKASVDGSVPDDYPQEDGEHIPESFVKNFSFETSPRHEEISWLMAMSMLKPAAVETTFLGGRASSAIPRQQTRLSALLYAIYWHHAKPLRKPGQQEEMFGDMQKICDRLNEAGTWDPIGLLADLKTFLLEVKALTGHPMDDLAVAHADDVSIQQIPTPKFKALFEERARFSGPKAVQGFEEAVRSESYRTASRSAIVSADRIVSALSANELKEYVATNTVPPFDMPDPGLDVMYKQIEQMQAHFETLYPGKRCDDQSKAAKKLAGISLREGSACLQGPAGCGKSKIALQYLLSLSQREKRNRRVFVFVPRTAIGESLFHEMVNDYHVTHGVELLTGSQKLFCKVDGAAGHTVFDTPEELQGTGNLVITTIDQMCKAMLSHQKIDLVTQMAMSHVVFDEFHELGDINGIVMLFYELMKLRPDSAGSTLLVSATPSPDMLKRLGVNKGQVVQVETFNKKPFQLNLVNWDGGVYKGGEARLPHPFVDGSIRFESNAFVISNLATTAQAASISLSLRGRDVICFHSKFTPRHKRGLLRKIIRTFGTQYTAKDQLLVAGPIVQASLNITTMHMHTEGCTSENWLQRLGRVNRFGNMDLAYMTTYWAPNGNGLENAGQLASMCQRHRTTAFQKFLASKVKGPGAQQEHAASSTVTLDQIYAWYDEFHATPQAQLAYEEDFAKVMEASSKIFENNDFDPVQVPAFMKGAARDNEKMKLSKTSLRGRSFYILPAAVSISGVGKKAVVSLLWNSTSNADDVLTDELRGAAFDTKVEARFLEWTAGADKGATFSTAASASANDAVFLSAIAKKARKVKMFNRMKSMALSPEAPILVSRHRYEDEALIYLSIGDLAIGLIRARDVDARVRHPDFSLREAMS